MRIWLDGIMRLFDEAGYDRRWIGMSSAFGGKGYNLTETIWPIKDCTLVTYCLCLSHLWSAWQGWEMLRSCPCG